MALNFVFIIKVLFAVGSGIVMFALIGKHCTKRLAILFTCAVVLVAALAGQKIASYVPPLTDTVTITALGEKNEAGSGLEVSLVGFQVDGQDYPLGEVTEGKWFWNGGVYMWRPETDTRQPEGTTRTIRVAVPVGLERSVRFGCSQWTGKALVEFGDMEVLVDSYAEKYQVGTIEIGASEETDLIRNQIRYVTVYAAVLLFLSGMMVMLALRYLKNRSAGRAWLMKHRSVLTICVIALAQLIFALKYAGVDCFWVDELMEINWSVTSDNLLARAFCGTAPLPLFGLFNGLWYEIAPYGEKWLLLPAEIVTCIGVFFVGMAGKELRGETTGVMSALLAAISATLLRQCSYEIRSYGFYFAGAALVLYLFLRHLRRRQEESWKAVFGMGAAMIFFADMHYHAVFSCVVLCLIDILFLCYTDKLSIRKGVRLMVPYVMAACSYIPNFANMLMEGKLSTVDTDNTWQAKPTYYKLKSLFDFFSSSSEIVLFFFVVGSTVATVSIVYAIYKHGKKADITVLRIAAPLLWLTAIIAFIYVYGNYRYAQGISSLWVERYFCSLLPSFFVLVGVGIHSLAVFVKKALGEDARGFWIAVILVCVVMVPNAVAVMHGRAQSTTQAYRAAADWLYAQGNTIYNDSTLVICTGEREGWSEYYLTQQGRRDPLNVQIQHGITKGELDNYYRIYVQYWHVNITDQLQALLDADFTLVQDNTSVRVQEYVRK